MSPKIKSATMLLFILLVISKPVLAHTDINTDAGVLSNIIAIGLVVTSIIIFLLVSRRKERKQHGTKNKRP